MLRSSLPVARILGIEVRVHTSMLLFLFLAVGFSLANGGGGARGLGLWLVLCLAVVVREGARALAAVYTGLPLRGLLLLPIGGVLALDPTEGGGAPAISRAVTLAGPLANLLVGSLLLGICYALVPNLPLFQQPWVSTRFILRSMIWLQFLLGLVSLLPAGNLPTAKLLGSRASAPAAPSRLPRPFSDLGALLGVLFLVAGFVLTNLWVVAFGSLLLLGAQLRSLRSPAARAAADSLLVRDVMLRDYTVLSSSDTYRSALGRVAQSIQDTFPVLRGDVLVGSISRGMLASQLRTEGDGYLQGAMNRTLQTAEPAEPLNAALRRASALGASELIPVVENGAVLGILTPQSLARTVQGQRLASMGAAARSDV